MKVLNFDERVKFVNEVVNSCDILVNDSKDPEYHPAAFDVVFRAFVLKYFHGLDLSAVAPDDLCDIVYSDKFDEDDMMSPQIIGLYEACREKIERAHKEFLIVALMNKLNFFDELVDTVDGWLIDMSDNLGEVDVNALMSTVDKLSGMKNNAILFDNKRR